MEPIMKPDPPAILTEGRSKRIYRFDQGLCLVELLPTLDSFTTDRHEIVEGTAELRLDFHEIACERLAAAGVATAFVRREDRLTYVARWLPGPPFEVIVKNRAVGSTLRKYPGLFPPFAPFDPPVVRFDYRATPEDQPIGEDYLRAAGIDPAPLRRQALRINQALREWLAPLDLLDICFIFGPDGRGDPVLTSEVSPDCFRLQDARGESYDKDLFRQKASPETIITRWRGLVDSIRAKE